MPAKAVFPIYDPETGIFMRNGRQAGYATKRGYLMIHCNGKAHLGHRLAWFITYGAWPEGEVDHIDGNPRNNAISNLRVCSRQNNACNSKTRADNSTGIKGVRFEPRTRKWIARIRSNGRLRHIGTFTTAEMAHAAYMAAAQSAFGEYARSG